MLIATTAASTTPPSVGLAVAGAVLLAAVLHAVWNALAHAITDQLVGFALMGVALTVGGAVIVWWSVVRQPDLGHQLIDTQKRVLQSGSR